MKWQTRIETLIRTCKRREANRGTQTGVQEEEYVDLGIREKEKEAAMEGEFYRRSTIWGRKFAIGKCRVRWCVGTRVYIEDGAYDFFFFWNQRGKVVYLVLCDMKWKQMLKLFTYLFIIFYATKQNLKSRKYNLFIFFLFFIIK